MNMNGIGNSAASWAQFVKISQAARERNGIAANGNGGGRAEGVSNAGGAQEANIVSFKKAFDVYSNKLVEPPAQSRPAPSEVSRAGGLFDAYA